MKSYAGTIAAGLFAGLLIAGGAQAQDKIKIGYAVSLSGPNAAGAAITTVPNYKLWFHDIEAAGGIKLGDKRVPIEVVAYDDQSSNEELIKAVERLVNQDKVDILLSPWGTGMNLAVGPTFAKYGYPQLAATAATDHAYEMAKRWPNSFWMLGTSTMGANSLVEVLDKLHNAGKINDQGRHGQRRRRLRHRARQCVAPGACQGRLRAGHGRELPDHDAGLLAAHQPGQGLGRRYLRRLLLSAGHLRPVGHGGGAAVQSAGLLHRRRHRLPGLSRPDHARQCRRRARHRRRQSRTIRSIRPMPSATWK